MTRLLTYGMIGDRLSDLVAELREFDEVSNPAIQRVISNLDAIREDCDKRSLAGVGVLNDAARLDAIQEPS